MQEGSWRASEQGQNRNKKGQTALGSFLKSCLEKHCGKTGVESSWYKGTAVRLKNKVMYISLFWLNQATC